VSQEMVRHGGVDDGDTEAAAVKEQELESQDDKSAESRDGWLSGWKLPVLSEVVDKTSSIVHQTSNVVRRHFCFSPVSLIVLSCQSKCISLH